MSEPKWELDDLDGKPIWRLTKEDLYGGFVVQGDDGRWRCEVWCLRSINMLESDLGDDVEECKNQVEKWME